MWHTFWQVNQVPVQFVHGLVFFLLGFAVLLQVRARSALTLARSLPWLGAFGIVHALADWADVFIPIQATYLEPAVTQRLEALETLLGVGSYVILLAFGLRLWNDDRPAGRRALGALGVLFAVWALACVVLPAGGWEILPSGWTAAGVTIAHHFFATAGPVGAAVALARQKAEFVELGLEPQVRSLGWLVFALFLLAVGSLDNGLLLPADLFHGLSGLLIMVFTIRILESFKIESARRLEEAERLRGVLVERDRIARELHDGIIQSLYAVGLQLESCTYSIDDNPSEARQEIAAAMERLRGVVADIRRYIAGLRSGEGEDLKQRLARLVEQVSAGSPIAVVLHADPMPPGLLRPEERDHIVQIVRESLSNAIRHGRPRQIRILARVRGGDLFVSVVDDGRGFVPPPDDQIADMDASAKGRPGAGQGLRNMAQRARLVGGKLRVSSAPGAGTRIDLEVPLHNGARAPSNVPARR
ncbi:MAG TPA: sensor histidine kinase [Limnochordia bacterium]